MREAFAEASKHAKLGKPAVIFIDEIDAICPRRDSRYVNVNIFQFLKFVVGQFHVESTCFDTKHCN